MTHDDALLRALAELDQPVDPPAGFADRLERQMRAEAALSRPKTATPLTAPVPLPVPHERLRRSRFSTVAGLAAAVLLIAIIGNLWALTHDTGTPHTATTIDAPATPASELFAAEAPLMPGRSAANDGQIPGVVPDAGSYQRLWQRSISNFGFAALYGDALYYLSFAEDGGANRVVALDAATGDERWAAPMAWMSSFSLLPGGVVVATAESSAGPNAFRVALLNHQTGQPIWRSAAVFGGSSGDRPSQVDFVLAGNLILFVDGNSSVIALDPASGAQRWRYDTSAQGPVRSCAQRCSPTTLVASDSLAYFTDTSGNRVTALALADGSRQWDATVVNVRRDQQTPTPRGADAPMQMTAVDQGVIVYDQGGFFGLLSAADGSMAWSWPPDSAIYSAVRVQSSIYVAMLHGEPEQGNAKFRWAEVEIATGKVLRSGTDDPNRYSNMVYLPDANRLIGGYRSGPAGSWMESIPYIGGLFEGDTTDGSVAMDPTTLAVTWESSISRCIINLPVAPDGKLLCNPAGGDYGEIAVYAPKP
jgi:outer membrane protein assembly factor BamB